MIAKIERQSWDDYFMDLAHHVSSRSKDRSTKIGAVIVGPDKEIRSTGYNGFPRKVDDNIEKRHNRPQKYLYTEHSERNAIYNAARCGIQLEGCIIYISGMLPCADCARAIIQSGIKEVVVETLEMREDWKEQMLVAKEMLDEADIEVRLCSEPIVFGPSYLNK
jgi:dCMP deaminase